MQQLIQLFVSFSQKFLVYIKLVCIEVLKHNSDALGAGKQFMLLQIPVTVDAAALRSSC